MAYQTLLTLIDRRKSSFAHFYFRGVIVFPLSQQSSFLLPDRLLLPLAFDHAQLQADLTVTDDFGWIDHLVAQNYQGIWTVLPLRHRAGATHPVMQIFADPTATVFEDTPLLARMPYVRSVLAAFDCPLQCVRLMRLAPGSIIKEHCDHDLAAEWGSARIHVPITTNDQVEFLVNRVPVVMAPGSAWYLRLADPHSVANRGTSDRIHLVIDCTVNAWLMALLEQAAGQGA